MIEIKNLKYDQPSEPFDVKVDRTSPLGNPFAMTSEKERTNVCEKFEDFFEDLIQDKETFIEENKSLEKLKNLYNEHKHLRLFCWCAPKKCHAETIKKYILSECSDIELKK